METVYLPIRRGKKEKKRMRGGNIEREVFKTVGKNMKNITRKILRNINRDLFDARKLQSCE